MIMIVEKNQEAAIKQTAAAECRDRRRERRTRRARSGRARVDEEKMKQIHLKIAKENGGGGARSSSSSKTILLLLATILTSSYVCWQKQAVNCEPSATSSKRSVAGSHSQFVPNGQNQNVPTTGKSTASLSLSLSLRARFRVFRGGCLIVCVTVK